MTEAQKAVWRFAVSNPDYWPLLRNNESAPELAALGGEDREAFQAARHVAQERAVSLLRRCWDDLGRHAERTRLYRYMADRPQRSTILDNKMGAWLPDNKGSIYLGVWGSRGVLSLWATVHVAKKRIADLQAAWGVGDDVHAHENRCSLRRPIAPDLSDAEVSAEFTELYWPRLSNWLGYKTSTPPDGGSEEVEAPVDGVQG